MNVDQRRARLGVRHHLAGSARAASVAEAADSLLAVHSTDPASVFLGFRARVRDIDPAAIEAALYDERSVVRTLAMRRTLFVVHRDALALVHAGATTAIHRKERARLVELLGEGERRLRQIEDRTVAELERRGEATAAELTKAVPDLARKIRVGGDAKWATDVGLSSRVLLVLAMEGRIIRGRPRGTWISTQYRWAPTTTWLGAPIAEVAVDEAHAGLARRWLRAFGPAPATDLKWWAGWTVAETKRALAGAGAVELDDGMFAAADDLDPVPEPEPWVALLGPLDTTPMGWSERAWFLGDHKAALFDRNGNIGPTVWCDGRIVGGWGQRKDGEIAVRLLEDVGRETAARAAAEAAALQEWLGDIRFTARFPTPLQRELSAGP